MNKNPKLRFKDKNRKDYPDWEFLKLEDVAKYEQPSKYIVNSESYNNSFTTPVLTANKSFILGYTDEKNGIYTNSPVIIFDDFTTDMKFVDFPFKVKSSAIKILTPRNNQYNIKFIYETMKNIKFSVGSHKRYWISEYSQLEIFFPCLKEQERIANFFTHLDNQIKDTNNKLELIKTYKKSMLQRMFSDSGNPEVRFKAKKGGDYPDWDMKRLSEITEMIKDGTHGTHIDIVDGVPLLSAKDVKDKKVYIPKDCRKISSDDFNTIHSKYRIQDNDILLTIVGTIGRVALVQNYENNVFTLQRSVAIIRANINIHPKYLIQYFDSIFFQNDLIKNQSISAQPGIYLGDIGKLCINFPCLKEQEQIANFLSSIDSQIDGTNNKLGLLKIYKKSMLQKMFI